MSSKYALVMLIYALQSDEIEPWVKASVLMAGFGVFVIATTLRRWP